MYPGTLKNRLIALLIIAITSLSSQASHLDDGWIHFEHLANSQRDYVVTLYATVSTPSNALFPSYGEIHISDGQQYSVFDTLQLINPPAYLQHNIANHAWWSASDNCLLINGNQQHYKNHYYVYRDTIRLPNNAKYTITKQLNPSTQKANTVANNGAQRIYAVIDHRFGPVNLPLMSRDMLDQFLPINQWLWKGQVDTSYLMPGDSFSMEFYHGNFYLNGVYAPLPYQPGYTAQQPLGANRSVLLPRTQLPFRFRIEDEEEYMVVVRMSVKRYDSQSQSWIEVGSSEHDFNYLGQDSTMNVSLQAQFSPLSNSGFSPSCGDSLLYLKTNTSIYPPSLDPQGSQFWLQGANGQVYPIVEALQLGTDSIRLRSTQALNVNQTYSLQIRADLNSGKKIQSLCGVDFPLDTLGFTIQDCAPLSLNESKSALSWYPNPSSGQLNFRGYTPGTTYQIKSVSGKPVAAGSLEPNIKLELAAGIYLLEIKKASGESLLLEKLLIRDY
jgi:hypothetical protein